MPRQVNSIVIAENQNEVRMIEQDYDKLWNSYGGDVTVDEHVGMATQIWKKVLGA